MKAIAPQLESIVSAARVCDWESVDVARQKSILQAIASTTPPSCIVYPHTPAELAEVMICADRNNWRILPCGSGSKLGWGGIAAGIELVVSTAGLNQEVQHAVGDLTVTAASGTKFTQLQTTLATAKQFLALDPAVPESATLGGIVATADTGSFRQRYRGVRDQLLGISFVRADGEIAKAGGKVVKNVAGYDLMKLFTGSYGTLGIITSVTFRVYPLPEATGTVVLTGTAEAIAQATNTLRASALTPIKADVLSTQLVARLGIGQGLGLIVSFGSMAESVQQQSATLVELGQKLGLQPAIYSTGDETDLWQQLQTIIRQEATAPIVTCKLGVIPTASVATLTQLDQLAPQQVMGMIHAGTGLGTVRFTSSEIKPQTVLEVRSLCQQQAGFLSILEAPITLKQQLDVWGYSGNALDLMRRIKQQFDPKNLLSPHRFVAGI